MRTLNRVTLLGRLGSAPELMQSKTGKPYARLSLATRRWRRSPEPTQPGEKNGEEKTDWHSVFVFGPLAERCVRYLQKGSQVHVDGSLTYWKIASETGNPYRNAIHADDVIFLGSPRPTADLADDLDNLPSPRNHENAVPHPVSHVV